MLNKSSLYRTSFDRVPCAALCNTQLQRVRLAAARLCSLSPLSFLPYNKATSPPVLLELSRFESAACMPPISRALKSSPQKHNGKPVAAAALLRVRVLSFARRLSPCPPCSVREWLPIRHRCPWPRKRVLMMRG